MNEQTKYEAAGEQIIRYKKEKNGQIFTVGQKIDGLPDAAILEYAKNIEQLNTQTSDSSYEFETRDEAALEKFWRAVCVGTVNLKTRDGREVSEVDGWQAQFLEKYYADAITVANYLLSVQTVEDDQPSESGEDFFIDDVDSKTLVLKVPFGCEMLTVTHELASPNAAQSRRYKEITKNKNWRKSGDNLSLVVRTQADAMLRLYDQVKINVTGYEGEPPAHHKIFAVRQHFAQNAEIVEKN